MQHQKQFRKLVTNKYYNLSQHLFYFLKKIIYLLTGEVPWETFDIRLLLRSSTAAAPGANFLKNEQTNN